MDDLQARLEAMDRKLDYVVQRQRTLEELIDEMTPVAREAIGVMAERFAEWERKGWFALLEPSRIEEILEVATDATDVLQHAGELKPVGVMGAVRASSDKEVQRGLAVALEILKHLGRAHEVPSKPPAPIKRVQEAPPPPPSSEIVVWEGVRFTSEGFLVDPADWSEELARKMAAGLGIALTDEHWQVLRWARADFLQSGASPNVRRVAAGSGAGTRRLYELFPKTPGKSAAMIAGIPKPVGCV